MKIYRHRLKSDNGPPLTILHPDGTTSKSKTTSLGATISRVQKLAENGAEGIWSIREYDQVVATITRTAFGVFTAAA